MRDLLRILLVEDNPGDADLIREMLPGNGPVSFNIENVARLSDALLRAGQDKFDIILLDLGLPDSMGLDTVRTIRSQIADIPIVVLTGTNDEQIGLAAIQEGAQDYLIKGQVGGGLLIRTIHYAIERKRAEDEIHNLNTSLEQKVISRTEELQKSEERYRVLYESSRDAIMLTTPETGFFAGNPAAIELFGCRDEKEFTTHAPSDLSPEFQPDGLPSSTKAQEMMKTALEKGSHYFEWMHKRVEGAVFPATVLLTKVQTRDEIYLQATVRDITEKKKSEDILKRSHDELERLVEERTSELKKTNQTLMEEVFERKRAEDSYAMAVREWSATFDAFNDPVWLLDLSGKILRSNKAASDVFNIDPIDLIGKKCWEIVHQTKTPVEGCPFVRMKTTQKREDMEFKLGDKYLLVTADPVTNAQDTVVGAVHIIRDITERRLLEDQFRQSQKMESLGIVASGIAHDFNNLFQVITGNIELTTFDRQLSEKSKYYLSNAMVALKHAAGLTYQMLAYSGKSIFFPVNINLNEIIRDVKSMLDASIPKNVRVDYKLAPGLPDILSDETQMTQIIMNLMINAYESIGDNSGTISLSTGAAYFNQHELDSLWIKETLEAGEYVFIEVKDTGCGMDTVTLEKLFDPFFTTKFIGRGLGLSAVQGILRAHKGTVKLESKPGEGTTFRVFLPVSKTSEISAEVETPVMEKKKSPGLILIVDDDEQVLNVGADMLIESGFEVIKAVDGIKALEILTDDRKSVEGAKISCIVLDIAMPGMGGGQTLAKIREIYPEIPVIIISGFPEGVARKKLGGMEFPPFLKKPFPMAELVNLIDDVMKS